MPTTNAPTPKPIWMPARVGAAGGTAAPDERSAHALEHIAVCFDRIETHLARIATRLETPAR